MPTLDEDIPEFSMPILFKASKRASRITKVESMQHREAAIRHRFGIDKSQTSQVDLLKVYENLEAGKFPTNEQLCQAFERLAKFMSKRLVRSDAMVEQEQEMIDNFIQMIDSTRDFIIAKNENSDIQRFLYHLRLGSKSLPETDAGSKLKDLMTDWSFLEKGRDLIILLVMSSDFRSVMSEFSQTIARIFSKQVSEQTSNASVQKDQIDQLPQENRESVLNFINLMDEIAENEEYQGALNYVLTAVRKSEREIKDMVKSGYVSMSADKSKSIDANLAQARKELKEILEKVAGRSLQGVGTELSAITNKLKDDYKLRSILDDLITFVERCLRDDEFRHDPDTILVGSNLVDQTRSYISSSCGENIQKLFNNLNEFLKAIQEDAHVQKLSQASKSLLDNFYYKIGERMVLNQDLVNGLIMNLLPNLLDQLRMVTIPCIKASTPNYDFKLEKFELSVDDVLPSYVETKISKGIIMGIRDQIKDQKYSSMSVVLHELHIDVQSIPFSYKLKSIRLQDSGTLDMKTQKTGISLKLKLHYYAEDLEKTIEIENSDVFIDKIKLKIQGRHGALYWLFSPSIKNMIRSQFTASLQKKIREYVHKADKIVTSRKVQYKRSTKTIDRPVRERRLSQAVKDKSGEVYPWESNIFDLTYV